MRAIAVFVLIGSIAATSCGGSPGGENVEIRVLPTSYELKGESYRSIVELESAVNALPGKAISISVSSCADESRLADVATLLRDRQANVGISTFEEACQ